MIETERRHRSVFSADRSGQSAPVAVALLLGITLLGTGTVLVLGSGAFADAQASATHERVEQAMTALDARAADVALGGTTTQRLALGPSGGGAYAVDRDAGRISVVHRNATGDGHDETIYDGSLGAVTYRDGETTVAFQGGGVWRRQGGGTVMVSPPEFHYRTDTLTLPIVDVTGSGEVAGEATARLTSGETERVYPNASDAYDEPEGDRAYVNPLRNGTVVVTVESDYYEGWAEYFRTRTAGNVTVDHDERTATVELIAPSVHDQFERIEVRGHPDDHAVEQFEVTMGGWYRNSGGKLKKTNFNNLDFSYQATQGPKELDIEIRTDTGIGQKVCEQSKDATLAVEIEYRDRSTGAHHAWVNDGIDAASGPIRVECGPRRSLVADLSSNDTSLSYGTESTDFVESEFDHEEDDGELSETTPLGLLIRHYFAELGEIDDEFVFTADYEHSKNRIIVDHSSTKLDYRYADGAQITYLHITENRVEVDLG